MAVTTNHRLVDVHSHILYGIDDGAKTISDSMTIIKQMSSVGFTDIILTPHYIENTDYIANNSLKKDILGKLEYEVKSVNIPVNLYLGNEIFIEEDIISKILKREIHTLNNTNYILLEFPRFEKFTNDEDILYELITRGVKVVLAHPERYLMFQKNPELVDKYLEMGVLLQGNYGSLIGNYGKEAQKLFLRLLKNREYFIIGTDIHRKDSSVLEEFDKITAKIIKLTDEKYFNEISSINPIKIIEGE